MIKTLLLAVVLLPLPSGFAQGDGPPTGQQPRPASERKAENPAPQLVRLDHSLTKTHEDKRLGRIDEKRYREFLSKFRTDLEAVMARIKPTPPNTALHARILSRLGDSKQALAALDPALKVDPASPALRVALGQVRYDQKDYPAALAEANAVLARDPANEEALALKYFSEGRVGPSGVPSMGAPGGMSDGAVAATEQFRAPRAEDSPKVQALVPRIRDARNDGDFRTAMSLTQELMRTEPTSEYTQEIYRIVAKDHAQWRRDQEAIGYIYSAKAALKAGRGNEALEWAHKAVQTNPTPVVTEFAEKVREIVGDVSVEAPKRAPVAPKNGGLPLWPLFPAFGLGAAAYAVAKSRKTVESEDGFNGDDRPQPGELQRLVAGSVLAGLAGAGIYLGGAFMISAGAPLAARFMSGPGKHAVRLAQSEAGAINPRSIDSVQNATKTSIWSPGKVGDPARNALGHWNKHNLEFPEFQNAKEYVEGAWRFIRNPPPGTLSKPSSVRAGETVFYNPTSNTLVIRGVDGAPKSMYRPDTTINKFATNLDYYNAQ